MAKNAAREASVRSIPTRVGSSSPVTRPSTNERNAAAPIKAISATNVTARATTNAGVTALAAASSMPVSALAVASLGAKGARIGGGVTGVLTRAANATVNE